MTNSEAIEELKQIPFHEKATEKRLKPIYEAIDIAIKALDITKLEQQSKTGHWKYVQYDYDPSIGNWHCSECRNIVIECVNNISIYKYCPNCGAKMGVEA